EQDHEADRLDQMHRPGLEDVAAHHAVSRCGIGTTPMAESPSAALSRAKRSSLVSVRRSTSFDGSPSATSASSAFFRTHHDRSRKSSPSASAYPASRSLPSDS